MKQNSILKLLACCSALFFSVTLVQAQGSLTPPGAPAPTMKSLSQIEPRTPISGPLPITITNSGSYYLTTNLVGVSGYSGISINTNDVYLDLNGFTIIGVSNSLHGIVILDSYTNITICNGTVERFSETGVDGYSYAYPRNVIMEHLTVSDNGNSGILAEATSIVRDCLSLNNSGDGFFSDGALFINCVSRNNSGNGFNVEGSTVHSCVAHFNGSYGVAANNSTVMDCDILNNTNSGISVGSTCHIVNNRIANHTGNSGGNLGDALNVTGSYNVIANNSALNNTYGIFCNSGGTNNVIVQNKFLACPNNAVSIYDVSPMLSVTPSTAVNVTNANAWVNFSW